MITARASAPVNLGSVGPIAGPQAGGIGVDLFGSGFQAGVQVQFGTRAATVISQSSNQISVTLPAQDSFGSMIVQVRNPDGGMAQLPAAFNYYEPLPAGQLSAKAASTDYIDPGSHIDRLDVFGRGTDSVLYHTFQDPSGHWFGWEPLGGTLRSAPAAVSWSPGRLDVFTRGTDNGLWHKWWDGTRWNGWEPLGGVLTGAPAVSSWSGGRLDVFVRGTDQGLWHKWWDGTRWGGWEGHGGTLTSDPGATSWGPNRIDVFVLGTDNDIHHRWWDGRSWGGWEALGVGPLSESPVATSDTNGALEVFAIGPGDIVTYFPYSNRWIGSFPEGPYWSRPGGWGFGPAATARRGFAFGVDVFEVANDQSAWHTNLPRASDFGSFARPKSTGPSKPPHR